jgi:hypothetical protein
MKKDQPGRGAADGLPASILRRAMKALNSSSGAPVFVSDREGLSFSTLQMCLIGCAKLSPC